MKCLHQKETTDSIIEETEAIERQIIALSPSRVMVDDEEITVRCQFVMSMVDGKVVNALTGTKFTHLCFVCRSTVDKLSDSSSPPSDVIENYRFGLQTLHAWIRMF